mmetsp:Transcript_14062/g.23788  ORF Transcript_14062/g.23788 Transcript_14062/m.23788 type:complete len:109 (+) Transcript_14062:338-664(+)
MSYLALPSFGAGVHGVLNVHSASASFVVADKPSANAPIMNLRLNWLLSNWSAEEGVDETLATAFIAGTERVTVETFADRLTTLRLLTDVAIVVVMILDVNGTKYDVFI